MNSRVLRVLSLGALLAASWASASPRPGPRKIVSGFVNLNQATARQLDLLPGIGPRATEAIIAYRQKTAFSRPEDLMRVRGFGRKRFEALKPHLQVVGPTTVQVTRPLPPQVPARASASRSPGS